MEPVEFRHALGKDYKTVPAFQEFLWQEGHTIHATYEEAEARTIQMFHVYEDCYRETLAIPFVSGRKAEHENLQEHRIPIQLKH